MSLIKIETEPSTKQLVQFGIAWLVFFMALAGLLFWKGSTSYISGAVAALAILVPLAGWFYRPLLKRAYVALSTITYPIGWIVSHLLLAVIYYCILTPTGLILRRIKSGFFPRKADSTMDSYWIRSRGKRSPEDYFKLY